MKSLIYYVCYQKISATYLAQWDYCLLSPGENMDWYQTWNVTEVTINIEKRSIY